MASKASLKLISQTCLQEKTQNVNGVNKHVRIIVKNHPSYVKLSLVGSDKPSFRQVAIEATLLYDGPVDKPVDFLKSKPLDYSGHVENGNVYEYSLELLINSLSSQHEDSLFKVKIQAVEPSTRKPIAGLCCYTTEILVISKPEVLKPKPPKGAQKRTREDQVLQQLARIERKLDEVATAGKRDREVPSSSNKENMMKSVSSSTTTTTSSSTSRPLLQTTTTTTPCFEIAIPNLLHAFKSLDDTERPEKLRKVVQTLREEEKEQLNALFELFTSEGVLQPRLTQQEIHPLQVEYKVVSPSADSITEDTLILESDFLRWSNGNDLLRSSFELFPADRLQA